MKKLFTSLTALALVSAMVVPFSAFATEQITGSTGSAPARGTVEAAYTVNIPSSITINFADAENPTPFTVSVPSTNCALRVTASADEGGKVKRATVLPGPNEEDIWEVADYWLDTEEAAYGLSTTDGYTNVFEFDRLGRSMSENAAVGKAQWTTVPTPGNYQGQVTFTITPLT